MDADLTGSGSEDGDSNPMPKEILNSEENLNNMQKNHRSHRNILERKRKEKIKLYISNLKDMIPFDYLPSIKKPASSNAVLEQAVTYMRHLKQQSELFLANNGNQAQTEEINRLRRELEAVTQERDAYQKMVESAAAVTPAIIDKAAEGNYPEDSPQGKQSHSGSEATEISRAQSTEQAITSSTAGKLPGQGLIITRSGQAYYVNEQGIPVAQGVAPTQLYPGGLLPSLSSVPSTSQANDDSIATPYQTSSAICSTSTEISTAITTIAALNTSVTYTTATAVPATTVSSGLVAIPGHTGSLPSAIILPNGQVIPVVGNSSTTQVSTASTMATHAAGHNSSDGMAISTDTSSSLVSSASSSTDVAVSTSTSANLVLFSSQSLSTNNTHIMSNISNQSFQDFGSQFGRKIMPKPTQIFTTPYHPMMAPITLTPIPVPACSISVGPPPFQNKQLHHEIEPKKKRTRKKKVKEVPKNEVQSTPMPQQIPGTPPVQMPGATLIHMQGLVPSSMPGENSGTTPGQMLVMKPNMFGSAVDGMPSVPAPMKPPPPVIQPDMPGHLQRPISQDGTSDSDILATATASLFSPEQALMQHHMNTDPLNLQSLASQQNIAANYGMGDMSGKTSVPTIPLTGVRARRTRKRKNKEAKAAEEKEKAAKKSPPPNATASGNGLPSTLPLSSDSLVYGEEEGVSNQKKYKPTDISEGSHDMPSLHELTGKPEPEQQQHNSSQSIEFDPNDLDNILDQVEKIDSDTNKSDADSSKGAAPTFPQQSADLNSEYQVVSGDEEIGPVFTTKPQTPTEEILQSRDKHMPSDDKPVNSMPYASSDSYLMRSLTKTEQPVDHRQQNSLKSALNSNMVNIFDAYNTNTGPQYNHRKSNQPSQTRDSPLLGQSVSNENSNKSNSNEEVNVAGLYKPRMEMESPLADNAANPWASISSVTVKRQVNNNSPMNWLSENKAISGDMQNESQTPKSENPSSNLSDYAHTPTSAGRPTTQLLDDHKEKNKFMNHQQRRMSQSSNPSPRSSASANSAPAWSPARESEWNQASNNTNSTSVTRYPYQTPSPALQQSDRERIEKPRKEASPYPPVSKEMNTIGSPYQYTQFNALSSMPPPSHNENPPEHRNLQTPNISLNAIARQASFSPSQSPKSLNHNQPMNPQYQQYNPQRMASNSHSPSQQAPTADLDGAKRVHRHMNKQQTMNLPSPQDPHQQTGHFTQQPTHQTNPHDQQSQQQLSAQHARKQSRQKPKLPDKSQHYQHLTEPLQPQQKNQRQHMQQNQHTAPNNPLQSHNNQQTQQHPNLPGNIPGNGMFQHDNPNQSFMTQFDPMHMNSEPVRRNSSQNQPASIYNPSPSYTAPPQQQKALNAETAQRSAPVSVAGNAPITTSSQREFHEHNPLRAPMSNSKLSALLSMSSSQYAQWAVNEPLQQLQNNESNMKQNAFSTEALLNKSSEGRTEDFQKSYGLTQLPQRGQGSSGMPPVVNSKLLQKLKNDRNPIAPQSQLSSAPFNVNLFASTAPSLSTLKSTLPSTLGLHYTDPSFTFSLTKTSSGPPTSTVAGQQHSGRYMSSSQPVSNPLLHHQAGQLQESRDRQAADLSTPYSGRTSIDHDMVQIQSRSNPAANSEANLSHPFSNKQKSQTQLSNRVPSIHQQQAAVKNSKRSNSSSSKTAQPNNTEAVKDFASFPYNFPGQNPYGLPPGIPPFSMPKGSEGTTPNIFAPQAIYSKSTANSLGLPFQPPGFPPLPGGNQGSFMPQISSSQINQPMPGFNINNIMKDRSTTDAEQNPMSFYPPQQSHLYPNPMNINNLFSGAPGFDPGRSSAMPRFPTAAPPGFPGFHHPFDLNPPNQQ